MWEKNLCDKAEHVGCGGNKDFCSLLNIVIVIAINLYFLHVVEIKMQKKEEKNSDWVLTVGFLQSSPVIFVNLL